MVSVRRADAARRAAAALRHPALRTIRRRLVIAVPLLFVVSALSFVLVSLTPGDAARGILGTQASPDQYEALRRALGLDQPLPEQYWGWLERALQGDLGRSVLTDEAVTSAIAARLSVTLSLMLGSLVVSVLVGVSLGVLSAVRGGLLGRAVDAFVLVGFAIPAFWLGAQLIVLFAVELRWLPATGYVAPKTSVTGWLESMALPVTALALGAIAAVAKQTRQAMLEVLGSEFVRMAWANGLPGRSVIFRHALRNASLPVLTVVGLQAVGLLGGTVIIESVFALPGLGTLAVTSAVQHDLPMIQGIAVCFTLLVVLINLLVDLAYSWLDPRVKTG